MSSLWRSAESSLGAEWWMGYFTFPAWMNKAACRNAEPDLFFPERGGSSKAAREMCASCPVVSECLELGLEVGYETGIFGGMSPKERRQVKRERKQAA